VLNLVRSLHDNHIQYLNTDSIKNWAFHSAFMNGDEVEVKVESKVRYCRVRLRPLGGVEVGVRGVLRTSNARIKVIH